MENRKGKSLENIAVAGVTIAAIALIGVLTARSPRPTILDITPRLGKQLERVQAVTQGQKGILLKAYDKESSREILFYDWGFDGTLDEVAIHGSGGQYKTHKPKDIMQWTPAYNEVRNKLKGTLFEPQFNHFVKRDHVSYVNKLDGMKK